jgi:hypothetical protein
LLFLREIDDRPELPFGDLPGIKGIAECLQVLLDYKTNPKEAQDLGDPVMG